MRTEIKLKIGEFSRLMQTTVKTLRHYEQIGLLLPDEVDEATGYRYYRMEQMQRLNAIKDLKSLGFSLDEIKDIYDDDTHTPSLEILEAKIDDCRRQLRELEQRRLRLAVLADSRKQLLIMEKFSIQSLPEIIVASHREVVENYDAIGAICVNVIGPEMQRLGCKCPPRVIASPSNTTKSISLKTSTSNIANKWKKPAKTQPLSHSNGFRQCPPPFA